MCTFIKNKELAFSHKFLSILRVWTHNFKSRRLSIKSPTQKLVFFFRLIIDSSLNLLHVEIVSLWIKTIVNSSKCLKSHFVLRCPSYLVTRILEMFLQLCLHFWENFSSGFLICKQGEKIQCGTILFVMAAWYNSWTLPCNFWTVFVVWNITKQISVKLLTNSCRM